MSMMKKTQEINEMTLISEILGKVVQEKSELVWIAPFSKEVNSQVCREVLKTKYVISEN